jgi:voltage-gated sodium channel
MVNIQQIREHSIALRDNRTFEMLVVSVIILSALLIGAKTYPIPSAVAHVIFWLDVGITFLFLFEIIVRFIAEPNKKRFFHNGWNVFDTLVVLVSLIPIDNSDMALVGRLVRVVRVLRMVSAWVRCAANVHNFLYLRSRWRDLLCRNKPCTLG